MTQLSKDPAARRARTGPGNISFAADDQINSPRLSVNQAESAATAPELLDLNYWNVELDLRLAAVKAIQAATDIEIGEPDDIAERNILVAINHLKDATARFRQIRNAKSALGDVVIAAAFR